MSKKLNYDFLNCAKVMPPLYHTLPNEKFDIRKSRVIWWLMKQPEILQKIFDLAANRKMIYFDKETGKWQGVDFDEFD